MKTDAKKQFLEYGKRLKLLRAYFGDLKQEEFALSFGGNPKSYSQWESGSHRISLDGALAIQDKYGISLDFIYLGNFDALAVNVSNDLRSMSRDRNSRTVSDKSES